MPTDKRIVAFVPMRHHSVRVEGKNYRKLGRLPLFHHILRTLSQCPSVSQIVVDTDSPVIRDGIQESFPQVMTIERPAELCADDVPMTRILLHDALLFPADLYLQTHSTNPFLRAETIEKSLQTWREARGTHDSLFTVTRIQARLWYSDGRPVNHDPNVLLRTQDLAPIFLENSNLYIFPPDLIRRRRRIGDHPKLYELSPMESIDIDDYEGFALAEKMMRLQEGE